MKINVRYVWLEQLVIWLSLCHCPLTFTKWLVFATSLEPGQHALTCSQNSLYTVCWSASDLGIPKNDNGQFQKMEQGGLFQLRNSAG